MLFLAVALVMGVRGYLHFEHIVGLQREQVKSNLKQLEATFFSLAERSSEELFRLADQRVIPSENEIASGKLAPPSLMSGVDSIYYLNSAGAILGRAGQGADRIMPTERKIAKAVDFLGRYQRPVAALNCIEQCFQSVFVPIIADDGRELIININRSAAVLIQDFFDITGVDIVLFSIDRNSEELAIDVIYAASNADYINAVLAEILKSDNYKGRGSYNFFDFITQGYYGARFFPLKLDNPADSYAAVIQNQDHMRALIIQAVRDVVLSTVITLSLILIVISLILKPSIRRLMILSKVLPMLPSGKFDDAKCLLKDNVGESKHIDEIDILEHTVGKVVQSLEYMNASVDAHKAELSGKVLALTEAKVFNDLILDSSPLVVVIHNGDGEVHRVNKLGRELTGLVSKSPTDANINTWVKNESHSKSLSDSIRYIIGSEGRSVQGQMPFFTEDGRTLYFLWTHTCLFINGDPHILSIGVDITERKEAAESLYWLGQHDRVTGLLNRNSFIEDASKLISEYRTSYIIELAMFDIDDFAIFNDRFGFKSGDRLLNDYAAHLKQTLPEKTLIARTGSGEFCAIVCHAIDSDLNARELKLESLTRFLFNEGDVQEEVLISIVVDSYDDSLSGVDELVSNTISTMRKVKEKARGSLYCVAESGDESRVLRHEKYRMREQLQSALNSNRLVIFFQPILDMSDNRISHCECLVRMLDDDGQFVSPAQFLGIAAEAGLMPQLDFSVMEKAMRQQSIWESDGIHIGLSINITAMTLEQADFESRLAEMIRATGANPASLIFEVVETDALVNLVHARKLLNNFKSVGAKIAFDDFGIGFTSFEYVRELPVDYIKIDQAFIRFIHERESDQVLVKSMVEMSHSLGKKVIVEGVENRAAFDIVRDIGVDYVQGYFVSRPVPVSALDLSFTIRDFSY